MPQPLPRAAGTGGGAVATAGLGLAPLSFNGQRQLALILILGDRKKDLSLSDLVSWKLNLGLVSRCCSAACAGPSIRLPLSILNRAAAAFKYRQPE